MFLSHSRVRTTAAKVENSTPAWASFGWPSSAAHSAGACPAWRCGLDSGAVWGTWKRSSQDHESGDEFCMSQNNLSAWFARAFALECKHLTPKAGLPLVSLYSLCPTGALPPNLPKVQFSSCFSQLPATKISEPRLCSLGFLAELGARFWCHPQPWALLLHPTTLADLLALGAERASEKWAAWDSLGVLSCGPLTAKRWSKGNKCFFFFFFCVGIHLCLFFGRGFLRGTSPFLQWQWAQAPRLRLVQWGRFRCAATAICCLLHAAIRHQAGSMSRCRNQTKGSRSILPERRVYDTNHKMSQFGMFLAILGPRQEVILRTPGKQRVPSRDLACWRRPPGSLPVTLAFLAGRSRGSQRHPMVVACWVTQSVAWVLRAQHHP